MIHAIVYRNDTRIMAREFPEAFTLERAVKAMEEYIVLEQLNNAGECVIKARFADCQED